MKSPKRGALRFRRRGEVERLLREKCAQRWLIPGSSRTRLSESTIKDWIQRYKKSGNNLESLYPRDRCDCSKTRAIDPETAAGLSSLKKEMPEVRLPVLMQEAQYRKIILPGKIVTYSSLYRLLLAEGLLKNIPGDQQDRRRFEAGAPNEGKTYGFAVMLDVNVNCRIKRGKDTLELDGDDSKRYSGGKLFGGKKETK